MFGSVSIRQLSKCPPPATPQSPVEVPRHTQPSTPGWMPGPPRWCWPLPSSTAPRNEHPTCRQSLNTHSARHSACAKHLLEDLRQRSANVLCERLHSKHRGLSGPCGFCCNYSTLCYSMTAALDNVSTNEHGYVPGQFYLQNQVLGYSG